MAEKNILMAIKEFEKYPISSIDRLKLSTIASTLCTKQEEDLFFQVILENPKLSNNAIIDIVELSKSPEVLVKALFHKNFIDENTIQYCIIKSKDDKSFAKGFQKTDNGIKFSEQALTGILKYDANLVDGFAVKYSKNIQQIQQCIKDDKLNEMSLSQLINNPYVSQIDKIYAYNQGCILEMIEYKNLPDDVITEIFETAQEAIKSWKVITESNLYIAATVISNLIKDNLIDRDDQKDTYKICEKELNYISATNRKRDILTQLASNIIENGDATILSEMTVEYDKMCTNKNLSEDKLIESTKSYLLDVLATIDEKDNMGTIYMAKYNETIKQVLPRLQPEQSVDLCNYIIEKVFDKQKDYYNHSATIMATMLKNIYLPKETIEKLYDFYRTFGFSDKWNFERMEILYQIRETLQPYLNQNLLKQETVRDILNGSVGKEPFIEKTQLDIIYEAMKERAKTTKNPLVKEYITELWQKNEELQLLYSYPEIWKKQIYPNKIVINFEKFIEKFPSEINRKELYRTLSVSKIRNIQSTISHAYTNNEPNYYKHYDQMQKCIEECEQIIKDAMKNNKIKGNTTQEIYELNDIESR